MDNDVNNQTNDLAADPTNDQTAANDQTPAGDPTPADTPSNIFGSTNAAETYDFTETCKGLGLELDQGTSDEYIALCKDCGINNANANRLAEYGLKLQQNAVNSVLEAQVEREQGWANAFREEAGKDYDAKLQKIGIAKEWAEKLHPGFVQMAIDTGAGNHPVFLNLMARLGDMVGEENGSRLDNGTANSLSSSMYDKTDFSKYK